MRGVLLLLLLCSTAVLLASSEEPPKQQDPNAPQSKFSGWASGIHPTIVPKLSEGAKLAEDAPRFSTAPKKLNEQQKAKLSSMIQNLKALVKQKAEKERKQKSENDNKDHHQNHRFAKTKYMGSWGASPNSGYGGERGGM